MTEMRLSERLQEIMTPAELDAFVQTETFDAVKQACYSGKIWMLKHCAHGFEFSTSAAAMSNAAELSHGEDKTQ